MLSSNHLRVTRATRIAIAIGTLAAAMSAPEVFAQSSALVPGPIAMQSPQALAMPQTLTPNATVAPLVPMAILPAQSAPTSAPNAAGATAVAALPGSQTVTGTLKQLEMLQREKAIAEAQRDIAEIKKKIDVSPAEIRPAPGGAIALPGLTPAVAAVGAQAPLMLPPTRLIRAPVMYKVLSIIGFRSESIADVIRGDVVTTVRVGDMLGDDKVVGIDMRTGVVIERKLAAEEDVIPAKSGKATGKKGAIEVIPARIARTERVSLQPAMTAATDFSLASTPTTFGPLVLPPAIPTFADATSVPIVSAVPKMPVR